MSKAYVLVGVHGDVCGYTGAVAHDSQKRPKKGDDGTIMYHEECHECGKEFAVGPVYVNDAAEWMMYPNRRHIQDVFPYLNPWEREAIKSHMCKKCQDKIFIKQSWMK